MQLELSSRSYKCEIKVFLDEKCHSCGPAGNKREGKGQEKGGALTVEG